MASKKSKKGPQSRAKRAPRPRKDEDAPREPGTAVGPYIAPEPEEPRRVFTDEERILLGDALADLFESQAAGPFVDPRAHSTYVRRRGRHPKLTAERALKVLTAVAQSGVTFNAAAALAGVDYGTMRQWYVKGKKENADLLYRLFRKALGRAVAWSEGVLIEHMARHARTDYRAALAMLERRFPDRWAPPAMTMKGDKDAPLVPQQITFRLVGANAVPGLDTPKAD